MNPRLLIRLVAAGRVALGVGALLSPGLLARLGLGAEPTPLMVILVRMVGARDAVLGLGAILAARRDSAAVRGWAEAGALADGVDAAVFATTPAVRPRARWPTVAVAATSAAASMWAARHLD